MMQNSDNQTFTIHTLGCKLNFSESSEIARQLTCRGFRKDEAAPAFIILNSCAVTAVAEKKGRNLVAKLHRAHPNAKIIVLGCYAALRPDEVRAWNGVVQVFGNHDKLNVVPFLCGETLPAPPPFFAAFSAHDRTRSFLKIQDGCDYHCAYCTVADARGESRSDTIAHVLENIKAIHAQNIKEIIITGVNLGDFGKNSSENFYDLLCAIEQQNLIERVRISSIEPNLLTDEIIDLVAQSKRIMPHFHVPLQAGSDRILQQMRRRYNTDFFAQKIQTIKAKIPDACVAVDIIAGFPGESDADFAAGYDFVRALPLSYLHVFTYSKRPGTPAAAMPNQVPPQTKQARTNQLLALSETKKRHFYQTHLGETRPVLWEEDNKEGIMYGFTDNYIKVQTPFRAEWANEIVAFKLVHN